MVPFEPVAVHDGVCRDAMRCSLFVARPSWAKCCVLAVCSGKSRSQRIDRAHGSVGCRVAESASVTELCARRLAWSGCQRVQSPELRYLRPRRNRPELNLQSLGLAVVRESSKRSSQRLPSLVLTPLAFGSA